MQCLRIEKDQDFKSFVRYLTFDPQAFNGSTWWRIKNTKQNKLINESFVFLTSLLDDKLTVSILLYNVESNFFLP
jgi:hypothetical protein